MKLLLTSGGVINDSIAKSFEDLIGKQPKDTKIAFVPTAANVERGDKHWLIMDLYRLHKRGFQIDIIELTALDNNEVEKALRAADVIFVGGGNTFFLSYWMQKRGLFKLIPKLLQEGKVYTGISAGSIVAGGSMALTSQALNNPQDFAKAEYGDFSPNGQASGNSMSLVNFAIRPHLNRRMFTSDQKDDLRSKAKEIDLPIYALDDQSALKVVDGSVEVITEGEWLLADCN